MSTTSEEIKYGQRTAQMEENVPLSRQITLQISPEQYERLFFQPTPARGDLSKRLANPTLMGLIGFLIPFQVAMLCCLELNGASSSSLSAVCGTFYFFGVAQIFAGIAEFVLGNTYPMAIFVTFGCHWLQVGYNNDPSINLAAAYTTAASGAIPAIPGSISLGFNAGNAMYNVCMACASFIFLIGTLRTNVPFMLIFVCLIPLFGLFAAGQFYIGHHHTTLASIEHGLYLIKVASGFGLAACISGWYLAIIQVCAAVGIPCPLPVVDLSTKLFKNTQAARDEAAAAGGSAVARPVHSHEA